jgi:hypothetical protein
VAILAIGHYRRMGDDQPERPRLGPKAKTEAELRRARQAKALRANLRRRKARDAGSVEEPAPPPERGKREP